MHSYFSTRLKAVRRSPMDCCSICSARLGAAVSSSRASNNGATAWFGFGFGFGLDNLLHRLVCRLILRLRLSRLGGQLGSGFHLRLFRFWLRDVNGIDDIEEVRGSRIAPGLGGLFSLLPAHLLDGVDERRLVGGSDAEGPHGLPVHGLLIHSALGGLFRTS